MQNEITLNRREVIFVREMTDKRVNELFAKQEAEQLSIDEQVELDRLCSLTSTLLGC